jgi:hypothetical protein
MQYKSASLKSENTFSKTLKGNSTFLDFDIKLGNQLKNN